MQAAFPDAPRPWVDLSTGINPWPYPVRDIDMDSCQHLPTRQVMLACRQAVAAACGAAPDSMILSPGSELIIRLLPTVISPRKVVVQKPTYGDHARVWRATGCEVVEMAHPLAAAKDADAVIICNPNNPDGRIHTDADLEEARSRLAARGGWLIVDEAYADLTPENSLAAQGGADGLIVLRSFGKFFGLAGLRLGALIAPHEVLTRMSERLGVWPVSGPALAIARQAYHDLDWQAATRERLKTARRHLDDVLSDAHLTIAGGCDLFRLVETEDATALWQQLAHHGIYVRRFDWSGHLLRFGLPPHPEAMKRLATALTP
jgi:cobalamin biosynthetic protein CobC